MSFKININNAGLNQIFNDIIIVFPLFLMIHITSVINLLNIIIIVLALLKIKKDGFKISFLEKYIFIFLSGLLISFIATPYNINKGISEITDILQWIFYPLILGQFVISDKSKRYMFYSFLSGIFVYFIRFYMERRGLVFPPVDYGDRYSGGYMISQISLILAVSFIFLYVLSFYMNLSLKKKIFIFVFFFIVVFMLLATKTRGVYLAILITVPLVILIRDTEKFFITILLGSVFLTVLIQVFPDNKYVERLKSITNPGVSIMGRVEVWGESIRIFKENPVNGIGYMNFKKAQRDRKYKAYAETFNESAGIFKKNPLNYMEYLNFEKIYVKKRAYQYNQYYAHSHSMIFKLLCETGIIGLLGYLLLNLRLLFRSFKKGKNDINYLLIFGILLILLLYELTDVLIWRNFAYPFIYFIFGVLLNSEYVKISFKKKA